MASGMLEAARRDAAAFQALVGHMQIHDSILGFHAQQAVEKAIKAVLFKHDVFVPRTHNIAQLLDALHDAAILAPPYADAIDTLNPYAVEARYGMLGVGALDRHTTDVWLNSVMDWAALQLGGDASA